MSISCLLCCYCQTLCKDSSWQKEKVSKKKGGGAGGGSGGGIGRRGLAMHPVLRCSIKMIDTEEDVAVKISLSQPSIL